ncbi:MAG TPA: hypothetical protein PLO61_04555, partial [Fimbriimonadaceae bacterium]|nr:hypothetical protein [Fimbriimonadaceae bacterium]HRJ32491.1 hypothetical protein [Fimbriimonadaceae bacterium]
MRIQSALCLIVAAMASSASAGIYTAECTNNLTVQNAGPRQGANGLRGFNVQGLDNVSFASYGIAEWEASTFGIPGTITDISSVTLVLEKWHAAFSTSSGNLSIWLTSSYGLSMDQALAGSSPFKFSFDAGDVPSGMDRTVLQFVGPDEATSPYMNASMQPVGRIATVSFTAGNAPPEPDGFVYNIPLNLIPVVETEIINRLNAGQTLRLIVAPDDISVDGVFAGYTQTSTNPITTLVRQGPTLVIDADVATANAVTGTVDFGQLTAAYNTGANLPTSIPVSFRDGGNSEIAT